MDVYVYVKKYAAHQETHMCKVAINTNNIGFSSFYEYFISFINLKDRLIFYYSYFYFLDPIKHPITVFTETFEKRKKSKCV